MGLFSKKKKDELVLVFDIGSASVGGALFHMGEDGVPEVIFTAREPILMEKKVNAEKFLVLTLEALKTVASRICMRGLGAPKRVFCVLSSPWHASQTRVMKYEKPESFVFTSKLVDELVDKEVKIFEEEYKANFSSGESKIDIIELKNMETKLNGYSTHHPFNQKATELELTALISISEEEVLKKIKEAISRHFRSESIRFSSFLVASFTVARDIFVNQENFLLVNIGGEVTDISMIKKDVLRESISFPMGRNFFVRGLAEAMGGTLEEASSHLSLYKDGHMAAPLEKNFEEIINKLKRDWLSGFQEFLSHLTNDVSIPATIFITVGEDLAGFFSETIKSEQFNQYILTESKFRVIFIGNQALHGVAFFTEGALRDSFLTIESIYINRFLR
jgi:hypothetical protein